MKYLKNYIISFFLILLLAFAFSCEEPHKYPNEPQIKFYKIYSVDSIDTLGNLARFQFINFWAVDGDANLGVKQEDTVNDMFFSIYHKKGGSYELFYADIPYRIPYTDLVGLNEYFKAEIQVEMSYNYALFDMLYIDTIIGYDTVWVDTIMYSFYVMDRDSNFSNVENTIDIPKNFSGFYIDTTAFTPVEL